MADLYLQGVLKAVSDFCDQTQPFVGERFKKQLRNTIRAVPRSRAPVVAPQEDELSDRLRALLDRYAEPCTGDCDHSQCPLLRELHALRIKATLEKARLTVKPIVDRERAGEFVGDLMNMRLRSSSIAADWDRAIEIVAAMRRSSLWNRDGYDGALSSTLEELRAAAPSPSSPVHAFAEISGILETHPLRDEYEAALAEPEAVTATPTPVSLAAREAAEGIAHEIMRACKLYLQEYENKITAIILKQCSAVTAAGGDEDTEQSELRFALEGMVAAFDNNEGDPEIRRVTKECAVAGAKRILGWPTNSVGEEGK